jgi:hypothetical protein
VRVPVAQTRGVNDRDPLPLQKSPIGQHRQHPPEHLTMCVQINQSARARDRRVVRRILVQPDAHEASQRQRIGQSPSNAALGCNALKVADQQRPEVDARRQRRTSVLGRIELRAPALDKLIELLRLQQLVEPLIERMHRC